MIGDFSYILPDCIAVETGRGYTLIRQLIDKSEYLVPTSEGYYKTALFGDALNQAVTNGLIVDDNDGNPLSLAEIKSNIRNWWDLCLPENGVKQ
jgi:hypothetical protein